MYSSGTEWSRLKCDGTPGGSGEEGGEGREDRGQGGRGGSENDTDLGKEKLEGKKKADARIRGEEGKGGE